MKLIIAKDEYELDLYYYFNNTYWFILSEFQYDITFGYYTFNNYYHLTISEKEL